MQSYRIGRAGYATQFHFEASRAVVADNPKDLDAKLDVVRFLGGTQGPEAAATELMRLIKAEPKATAESYARLSAERLDALLDACREDA